jgi:hypothetical protein
VHFLNILIMIFSQCVVEIVLVSMATFILYRLQSLILFVCENNSSSCYIITAWHINILLSHLWDISFTSTYRTTSFSGHLCQEDTSLIRTPLFSHDFSLVISN